MTGPNVKTLGPQLRQKLVRSSVGLLAFTGITILVAAGVAVVLNSTRSLAALESQIRANQVARGRQLVATQAMVFRSLVRDTALTEVQQLLALSVSESDVSYGVYSDAHGKPWSYCSHVVPCDSDPDAEILPIVSPTQVSKDLGLALPLRQESRATMRELTFMNEQVLEFAHPVVVDGTLAGTLRYGISAAALRATLSQTREAQQKTLHLTLAAIALVLASALVLGQWFARRTARRITQPLLELTSAAHLLARGDQPVHVQISSGDELETLGNAFNRMADDLRTSYSDLQTKNDELKREITERIQAQDERTELQAHLIQAQKMEAFGQLAGGVAHDFNNILAVILGNCELATEDVEGLVASESLAAHLAEIFGSAKRGAELTRQLLTFARKEEEHLEVVHVGRVLLEFEKLLRRVIEESVELQVLVSSSPERVRIDPGRLEQVMMNLCVNARDAMAGVGRLTLSTDNRTLETSTRMTTGILPAGKYVTLVASDNGHGIAASTIERIFEPFFTTKGAGRGTGLGLATVHSIVHAAEGAIDIVTEVNKGTTFTVFLPVYTGLSLPDSVVVPEAALPGVGHVILLCEDDPAVRRMTERVLRVGGYEVVATESGVKALEALQSRRFSALVTDVVMPDMDGRALAAEVGALYSNLPILFVSGYTAGILSPQGPSDSSLKFLRKPFETQELLRVLGRIIAEAVPSHAASPH